MKIASIIRRAGRSLRNTKARTALTSLAIGVGAFTLTLTLAAGEGANQYAAKLISSNFDPAEVFIAKDKKIFGTDTSGFSSPQEYDPDASSRDGVNLKRLNSDDIAVIKQISGVTSVRPSYSLSPLYVSTAKPDQKKYTANIEAYSSTQKPEFAEGSAPAVLANDAVLLPSDYVSILGFNSNKDAIGKEIELVFRRPIELGDEQIQKAFIEGGYEAVQKLSPFELKTVVLKVAGVTKKSSTSLLSQLPFYISLDKASELNDYLTQGTADYQKYTVVYAQVENGANKEARQKVVDALRGKDFNVSTSEETQRTLMQFISVLQGIVAGFGVLALLASVFGIINTQYISVLERTREIGLMKALGMRGKHVSRLFQFEAAWIGFLGGIIGSGLAVLAGWALNPFITNTLGLGENTYLLIFQPVPIIALIFILVVIAMLAGFFPARKAAKLDPIEALRTE